MKAAREIIQIPEGHSFRLLRWTRTVREVECLRTSADRLAVAGEGAHWHFHPEMELTLFTSGAGTRFVGDHIGEFAAGDLVLLGEKLPHYWHTVGPSSGLSVQWHFPPAHAVWGLPEAAGLENLFRQAGRGLRLTGGAAVAARSGMEELVESEGMMRLAGFFRLLAGLATAGAAERKVLSRRTFLQRADTAHKAAIARAVSYLAASFREPVRLEEVLALAKMTRPTFARQFKQHSGRTFSEFLNHLRLQAACRELQDTDRSVLELALGCGFSQISFFNRCFRRVMGCSPTDYRDRSRRRLRR